MKITVEDTALPIDDLRAALEPRGFEFIPAATVDPEPHDGNRKELEAALDIISRGSFPLPGERNALTPEEERWMAAAIAVYVHLLDRRDVFLTSDRACFVDGGRRERFAIQLGVRVMTPDEFRQEFL